ncbi:MAG TPA: HlyD family secretion protein [Polyangiaceae bacterium]|nr:HlyD family secretion protein [Polyangiaceae bacterium]
MALKADAPSVKPESRAASPEPAAPAETAKKSNGRRPFAVLAGVVLVTLAGIGGYMFLTAGRESTDDAQVAADTIPVGARVGGQVTKVAITDNQLVKKGDLIATLDDADFNARVKQSEAEVASARAQAVQADSQVAIVTATSTGNLSSAKAAYSGSSVGVASAGAQVAAAQAAIVRAETDQHRAAADLARAKELRAANAIPDERLDNAQSAFDLAKATVEQARAQLLAAQEGRRAAVAHVSEAAGRVAQNAPIDAQIAAAHANADLAHARVQSAEAALDLARLQLSYTKIMAPADGLASKLAVHEGQLVAIGQPIVVIVPTVTYVIANFKETQVGKMRPGQRASISIDAYPHREFEGKVESLSGGTGSSFSLLPADNASGNFVKVVQRVPVRIGWVNLPSDVSLRAGLSVDAVVEVGK